MAKKVIKDNDPYLLTDVPGIGPIGQTRLAEHGIISKFDVLCANPRDIKEYIGTIENEALYKAIAFCRKALMDAGEIPQADVTGWDSYQERLKLEKLTTGSKALDALLGGGLECQAVTEIYGEFKSGKSQLCHTAAVLAQRPKSEGGLVEDPKKPIRVIWVDTEHTYRPERMIEIAISRGFAKTPEECKQMLQNIIHQKVYDASQQVITIDNISHIVKEANVRLVIVDSGTDLFRSEYVGRGSLAARQQQLNHMVHILRRISENHNLPVIFINQVFSKPDLTFGVNEFAAGGNVVGHGTTYRVRFSKSGQNRKATMVDATHIADDECLFQVTEKGIIDAAPKKAKD